MLFCVTAYAKPHGQGFNNYDDKVTIVLPMMTQKKWIFRYRCEVYSYLEWRRISGNFGQDYGKVEKPGRRLFGFCPYFEF